jgi:hypothetical protein
MSAFQYTQETEAKGIEANDHMQNLNVIGTQIPVFVLPENNSQVLINPCHFSYHWQNT